MRNYFAHKNPDTARKIQQIARGLALPTTMDACQVMSSVAPGAAQTVVLDWLDELRNTLRLMT